ncbi:MAG TPA: DUF4199 domain-containing protein [Gemmatimonadaceae bacterium]
MKRIVLTFGLISGAILSAMLVAMVPFIEEIGWDMSEVVGYSSMVLAFLLIFFGVRSYRDTVGGGRLSFGRGFGVGVLIALVASACYVATWQVLYRTVAPDFTARYTEYQLEKERAAGASEAALAERRAELQRFAELYENPLVNIAVTFIEPLPVGLVMALLSAGILRRPLRNNDRVTTPHTAVST